MSIPDQKHQPHDHADNVNRSAQDIAGSARGTRRGPPAKQGRARSGWNSLTPTELKVAAFVEEGLSNPQIVGRLLLSGRTVGTHISHILKKLDGHSRTDIAREAAQVREAARAREAARRAIANTAKVRQRKARWVAPLAAGLLTAAARLLPAADRAWYVEEYRSELWEIAHAGAGRRGQLAYAARQLTAARRLRAQLRTLQRRGAALRGAR